MNRLDQFCKRGIFVLITITLAAVLAAPTFAAGTSCATKYPIILAHGMGFYPTDALPHSFPGIKEALEECGATVYITQVEPLGTSAEKAGQFINGYDWGAKHYDGINELKAKYNVEKFNIIGHSQGGLYTRWAITMGEAEFGATEPVNPIAENVASLTTADSPHLGSLIDDINLQLGELMPKQADKLADAINPYSIEYIATHTGETAEIVKEKLDANTHDLSTENMKIFNTAVPMPDPETGYGTGGVDADVYYQSFTCAYRKYNVLSALRNQVQLMIDLNNNELPDLSYLAPDGQALAEFIQSSFPDYASMCLLYGGGQGDGLVQVNDSKLGIFLGVERGPMFSDGLNHFDAININREPATWDAVGYYVRLVKNLKAKGF
jgi:hypothetical protein